MRSGPAEQLVARHRVDASRALRALVRRAVTRYTFVSGRASARGAGRPARGGRGLSLPEPLIDRETREREPVAANLTSADNCRRARRGPALMGWPRAVILRSGQFGGRCSGRLARDRRPKPAGTNGRLPIGRHRSCCCCQLRARLRPQRRAGAALPARSPRRAVRSVVALWVPDTSHRLGPVRITPTGRTPARSNAFSGRWSVLPWR
jgi:hypothetical protein